MFKSFIVRNEAICSTSSEMASRDMSVKEGVVLDARRESGKRTERRV
jgi:hypothetical protein